MDFRLKAIGFIEQSLMPHLTQYRSFWRWSSQPVTWLLLSRVKGHL